MSKRRTGPGMARTHSWRWLRLVAILAVLAITPAASAQAEARVPEEEKPIVQWITVVVSAGLFIAIACKNPKRTHLG